MIELCLASQIHLLVALEDRRGDKGLLAQVALVLLVSVVHHLDVHVERVLPLEGGVALVALECPLTCTQGETHTSLEPRPLFYCRSSEHTISPAQREGNQFRRGRLYGQKNTKKN